MKTISKILISCLTLGSAHAELVAHWPLDTDASDATGNGFDGTVVSGTVNFGQTGANANTGSSAAFPDNGHIDIPFDAALNPGSFTVALWANAATSAGFASPITSRDDVPATSVHGFILYNDSAGNWNFWTGTGGGPGAWHQSGGPAVALSTWTHLAITYDAATETKSLWVNGVVAATETNAGLYSPNGTVEMENFHIGSGQDDGENFYFDGQIDDVGIWDEALSEATIQSIMDNGITSGLPDPELSADNLVTLDLDGSLQSFDIPITNNGQTQSLNVSAASFNGDANFSVTSLPGSIAPGGTDNITIAFDPLGENGVFSADLEITSDDSLNPVRTTTLRGTIHDPIIVTDAVVDLGEQTTGTISVTNDGATRNLQISLISVEGDLDHFSLGIIPSTIPPGGSSDIDLTFNSLGEDGRFGITLTIETDDPINPSYVVQVSAFVPIANPLVAWWPLDVDGTDASGNGYDGTIAGALAPAEGANAATGGSLTFDGGSRIDVPFNQALNPTDFTLTMWANASSTAGFASPITSRDDVNGGESTHGFIVYNDNGGNWNFWTGDGNPGWDVLSGGPVTPSTWTHLAISYDSITETKTIYVDGALIASDTAANQYSPNGTVEMENLHIGAGADDGNSFFFTGRIDDVGLFRTALSEQEINTIMTEGVGGFTGASSDLAITALDFGPGDGQVTITFNSVNNATYIVERSVDLLNWEELTDNVNSTGETTNFTDLSLPAGTNKVFYRVSRP